LRSTGEENEFIFSVGSSYNEQLYIGATIGFPSLNYYELSVYNEHSFEDTINTINGGLHSFEYQEELSVYGSGIKTGKRARDPQSKAEDAANYSLVIT